MNAKVKQACLTRGSALGKNEEVTRSANVLIADDEPLIRDVFSVIIEMAGFNVVRTFADGRDLLDFISSIKEDGDGELWPDIIILDWLMPRVDGVETAKILRATNPGIKILIVAGSELPEYAYNFIDGYLKKPVNRFGLLAAISNVLAKKKR